MQTSDISSVPASMEAEFLRLLGEVRRDSGLRAIYVVVPTHVLGTRLLRLISAERPAVNVRFVTFPDLAGSVGIADLVASNRIPMPAMADFLAARKAIQAKVRPDGYFGPIKDFPGTPRAVLRTLTDLKKAGIGAAELRSTIGSDEAGKRGGAGPVQQTLFGSAPDSGIASAAEPPRNDEQDTAQPRDNEQDAAQPRHDESVAHRRKLLELGEIYEEVERLKGEAGYFDESDCLAIAAGAAFKSKLLDEAAAVVLYGFSELNELEKRFFAACAKGRTAYAFVPEDVAEYTGPLRDWLETVGIKGTASEGIASSPTAPRNDPVKSAPRNDPVKSAPRNDPVKSAPRNDPVKSAPRNDPVKAIISAPGVTQEVEEIARRILAFVEQPGGSFSDAAVLLRNPEQYERTVRDVFNSAGIPHVFLEGTPYADTLAGRLIKLLLRIRLGGYERPEVMEFLELAPLRASLLKEFPGASPADWDRYSREAGIVEGREQWARINDMRRRVEWRIDRERKKPADQRDAAALEVLEHDRRSLVVFEKTLNLLLKRLEEIPSQDTIAGLMASLLRALLSLAKLPDQDRAVAATLAGIARESVADEQISLQSFASLVEDLLQQRLPARDIYRTGRVVVMPPNKAIGLSFSLVAIPGLVERSFPPPPRQDPILLDTEREALTAELNVFLRTRERQALDEQFTFRHALGAAEGTLVLSYPRLDSATGQVRVASHFLLRVAEVLRGRLMDYEAFEKVVERIPIGRLDPGPMRLTPGEWDIAATAQAVAGSDGSDLVSLPGFAGIVRGARVEAARWGEYTFTQYDGMLHVPVAPPDLMAPTQLETYATCPFRFFGQKVLGVREIDEPESVETLSALDRGSILHDILEKFMSGLKRDGLLPFDSARKAEYQDRLRGVAREVFHEFEQGGAVGYPFMWVVEKERILTDLEAFLAGELAETEGFVPEYFEARFGPVPEWARLSPGSITDPLELPVKGRTLRIGGYIDRIDVQGGGSARVIDYKSGRNYGEKDNLFRGGKSLQLPLYMLAADAILKKHGVPARAQESQYYYITARGGFKRVVFTRDQFEARDEEFKTILDTTARGIASGTFPQNPDGGENCRFCEFTSVCGHARVALVDRKIEDTAIGELVEMWEIE
jgi:ATP-dependent helicase/nuclease subunit B